MESVADTIQQPLYRAVVWRVSRHRTGTTYIVVPKEFASLAGFNDGSMVELSVWRIIPRAKEEKKK